MVFQELQFLLIYLAGLVSPYTFKDTDKINCPAVRSLASCHRTTADKDCRDIQPQSSHQHARNYLVAIRDTDEPIKSMGSNHGLYRISNQFPARQGVIHANMSHGNSVIDANGVEFEWNATRSSYRILDPGAKSLKMDMTRNDVDITIADRNKGPGHIFVRHTGRFEKRSVRRPCETLFDSI